VTQDRLRDRIARLERIIEISCSLSSTLSLTPLLTHISQAACELTDTEASSILLVDRNTGELRFEAVTGRHSHEISSMAVPVDQSIAGWVIQHGKPLVVEDPGSEPRFYRQLEEEIHFETRSLMAVPLVVKGKLIGVLEVVNKRNDEPFSEEDQETLSILADQAAVAVENAVLFQQSDQVAEIVHEMRTPLTSIAGYAEIIQRDDISEEERRSFAGTIQREARRLSRLTQDFLDLARLETGRAFINPQPMSLEEVIQETIDLLHPQAEQQAVTLRLELDDALPTVRADRQRIHQALVNLLANAVKYCRAGDTVTVTAQTSADQVLIAVADTGPGIPKDGQRHLFEKFYRAAETEELAEGTGLGLAITRKIVESHGGRIWVESDVGAGTTFHIALPHEPPQTHPSD
jgi:signal transduction histidine kinase